MSPPAGRTEELADLFLGQTDARVADGKAQEHVILRFLSHIGGNDDPTLFRELDGVIGVIDEDLPQSERVAHEIIRSCLPDLEFQRQSFGRRLVGNQVGDIFHDVLQLEFRLLHGELCRPRSWTDQGCR